METRAVTTRTVVVDNLKKVEPETDCIVSRLKRIGLTIDGTKSALGNALAVVRGMAPADPGKPVHAELSVMEILATLEVDANEVSEMAQELRDKIGG